MDGKKREGHEGQQVSGTTRSVIGVVSEVGSASAGERPEPAACSDVTPQATENRGQAGSGPGAGLPVGEASGGGSPAAAVMPESVTRDEGQAEAVKPKKKKSKKRKKEEAAAAAVAGTVLMGTAKGVETMFRNAFRTEMELLALAATKANIMISLNGFIVSALMISGAFIFASSPEFLVPAVVFMLTAAASIVFALLSASPDRASRMREAGRWLRDVMRGRARVRDFGQRIRGPRARFFGDTPNILIYEDRVKIPKDRYWEMMKDLMADREQVYQKMSDELYWLGLMANKQFKFLNMSYAVFRWGLLLSMLAFIGVKTLPTFVPALQAGKQAAQLRSIGINTFETVYEPSAVQQLADGRLMVLEDEPVRAVRLLAFTPEGTLQEDEMVDARLLRGFKRKLNDMEALTRDDEGYVYAISSHSRTREGRRRPDRERFLRFRIQGNDVRELTAFEGLIDALENSPELTTLIQAKTGTRLDFKTTNIEGLAYDPRTKRLMLGFRDPEFNEKSMIVSIGNPKAMFEDGAKPDFVAVNFIDIKGGGIRSLNYDPVLKALVLTNEVKDEDGTKFSQLWVWSGDEKSPPRAVQLPNLRHMKNVEAVDSVKLNGQPRLILMSDEGNAEKKLSAKYMVVDYNDI
ncbi:MAG: DUF5706 domain-containing protein [Lautropia sp.]|nr:DUF5706 domain-containing protein [Lautropia sp.]